MEDKVFSILYSGKSSKLVKTYGIINKLETYSTSQGYHLDIFSPVYASSSHQTTCKLISTISGKNSQKLSTVELLVDCKVMLSMLLLKFSVLDPNSL